MIPNAVTLVLNTLWVSDMPSWRILQKSGVQHIGPYEAQTLSSVKYTYDRTDPKQLNSDRYRKLVKCTLDNKCLPVSGNCKIYWYSSSSGIGLGLLPSSLALICTSFLSSALISCTYSFSCLAEVDEGATNVRRLLNSHAITPGSLVMRFLTGLRLCKANILSELQRSRNSQWLDSEDNGSFEDRGGTRFACCTK